MEKFKVGDVVYDEVNYPNQKGTIIRIDESGEFPIGVKFFNYVDDCYTLDGRISNCSTITLSHTPYTVEFKGFSQERPKVLTDEMKVCIKGDGTLEYGAKILEHLKSLGGVNTYGHVGNCDYSYYYIKNNLDINLIPEILEGYKEITLKDEVEQELKVGIILVAIDNLYMGTKGQIALVKGKEYTIDNIQNGDIAIESELSNRTSDHYFDIKNYKKYFKIKDEVKQEQCYVGKKIEYNGSVLLIVQQDKASVDIILDGKQEVIMIYDIINGLYRIID